MLPFLFWLLVYVVRGGNLIQGPGPSMFLATNPGVHGVHVVHVYLAHAASRAGQGSNPSGMDRAIPLSRHSASILCHTCLLGLKSRAHRARQRPVVAALDGA